jgi:hypothetical protein
MLFITGCLRKCVFRCRLDKATENYKQLRNTLIVYYFRLPILGIINNKVHLWGEKEFAKWTWQVSFARGTGYHTVDTTIVPHKGNMTLRIWVTNVLHKESRTWKIGVKCPTQGTGHRKLRWQMPLTFLEDSNLNSVRLRTSVSCYLQLTAGKSLKEFK